MRVKTGLCLAMAALILTAGWTGDCFAESGLAGAPKDAVAPPTAGLLSEPAEAVVVKSADQADVQTDAVGYDTGGNARLEEAEQVREPKFPGQVSSSRVGIGLKISTLGVGVEAAVPVMAKFNLRVGANFFQYNRTITSDGIQYDGQLRFRSGEAHLDWFPFRRFHVSPGMLFYNGNQVTANASVPGGQTFTLSGTTYESDPNAPIRGTGKLDFVKVSPSIMVGLGSLVPRSGRHYSFLFEVGGAYQGSPRVALNLEGSVCDTTGTFCRSVASDPTVQANVVAQQQKIRNDIYPYRFFPVISLGVGFNF